MRHQSLEIVRHGTRDGAAGSAERGQAARALFWRIASSRRWRSLSSEGSAFSSETAIASASGLVPVLRRLLL